MLENKFKTNLIREIESDILPGSIVIHTDERQGFPDLIVLYNDRWAALEGKRTANASHRPNQDYYVDLMNDMSYAAFIYPENKEEVLSELQSALQPGRRSCISRR